jgi:hypothetical protein
MSDMANLFEALRREKLFMPDDEDPTDPGYQFAKRKRERDRKREEEEGRDPNKQ